MATLSDVLKVHGISQADVSAALGWSKSAVSRWVRGDRDLRTRDAARLVAFLRARGADVTLDSLFGEVAA